MQEADNFSSFELTSNIAGNIKIGRSPHTLLDSIIGARVYEANRSKLKDSDSEKDDDSIAVKDDVFGAQPGGLFNPASLTQGSTGSFQVYYDPGTKTYKLNKPLVIYGGNEIEVSGPVDNIPTSANGGWVVITIPETSESSVTAVFTISKPPTKSNTKVVQIFESEQPFSGVTYFRQKHIGAIIMGDDGGHALGNTNDSVQTQQSPLKFKSASDSNIQIKTEKDGTITIGAYYV